MEKANRDSFSLLTYSFKVAFKFLISSLSFSTQRGVGSPFKMIQF